MRFKDIKEAIFFYLSVPKCVGCKKRLDRKDFVLCTDCYEKYYNVKKRNCSICAEPLDRCSCTNHYLDTHFIHKLIKVYRYVPDYELPSNNLIYSLKRDNRKDVLDFLVEELSSAISNSLTDVGDYLFTNIPRRKSTVLKYGIDHAAILSKALAKKFSATYYQPLISKSTKQQKKMLGEERIKNARFRVKKFSKDLSGKKVIIVDDVVTTGASMGACAMLLKSLGAKKIVGASIAIAFKDYYIPFQQGDRFNPNIK